jgi:hypothetical protein
MHDVTTTAPGTHEIPARQGGFRGWLKAWTGWRDGQGELAGTSQRQAGVDAENRDVENAIWTTMVDEDAKTLCGSARRERLDR